MNATFPTIYQTLLSTFGFAEFRPLQEEIVNTVLSGSDAFVLMPTGGGKSLCYQLPALLLPGVSVVVSPLIALMKDQVDALVENGVVATFINSSLSNSEIAARRDKILRGEIKLVYVAPERLSAEFLGLLDRAQLSLIAIDEAHCISEWGHDFRSDYRLLSKLRTRFPEVPIIAMTATANERVQEDIIEQLQIQSAKLFRASFDRGNLFYAVRQKERGFNQVLDVVNTHKGESGIIYCMSRARTEEMSDFLNDKGIRALPYHAGLDQETRSRNQEKFVRDNVDVICATIAFGMGIDKPDVRYVIHYDLPKNMMSYYQETGRAGRDGLPSDCVLYYSSGDRARHMRFLDDKIDPRERAIALKQLQEMISFAETLECRRKVLLRHFSEEYPADNCGACDVCLSTETAETYDATRYAQMFLSCVVRLKESFGSGYVIDVLRGSENARILNNRHSNLSTYGIGKELSALEWRSISAGLQGAHMVEQDTDNYSVLRITKIGWELLRGERTLRLRRPKKGPARTTKRDTAELPERNQQLFDSLRSLRKKIADEHDVPAYVIFDNKTLLQMAANVPGSERDFLAISGVGETKLKHYGKAFLDAIAEFTLDYPELKPAATKIPEYEPPIRTPSARETLAFFNEGNPPEEIAATRKLSLNTVYQHLEALVAEGAISDISPLVPADKVSQIEEAFRQIGISALSPVREKLGLNNVTYNDLKIVRAWMSARGKELDPA